MLDKNSRTSTLSLLLVYNNFNDFFDAYQSTATVTDNIQSSVETLQRLRQELESKQSDEQDQKDAVEQAKLQLELQAQSQEGLKSTQSSLLVQAESAQNSSEALYEQAVKQEQAAYAYIQQVASAIKQRAAGEQPTFNFDGFIWPVHGVITTYFQSGHRALDIAVPQDTIVSAPAAGIVKQVRCFPSPSPEACLSQLIIEHSDGYLTEYLHMHKIAVGEGDIVVQGQKLGYSGGLPYTWGAGIACHSGGILRVTCHTTGAHLHFAIYKDGIPVNPLQYLP